MSCLFNINGARYLRVLLPVLFCLACLMGVRPAHAATAKVIFITAQYELQPDSMSSNIVDRVSWSYLASWDAIANPSIYCNYSTILVAQYFDGAGKQLDIGQGHFERTWPVPQLTGTVTTSPGDLSLNKDVPRGAGPVGSAQPVPPTATQLKYFYRLYVTVADGSNVYAKDSKESTARTIPVFTPGH